MEITFYDARTFRFLFWKSRRVLSYVRACLCVTNWAKTRKRFEIEARYRHVVVENQINYRVVPFCAFEHSPHPSIIQFTFFTVADRRVCRGNLYCDEWRRIILPIRPTVIRFFVELFTTPTGVSLVFFFIIERRARDAVPRCWWRHGGHVIVVVIVYYSFTTTKFPTI